MYARAQRDAIRRHLNAARQALDAGDRARAQRAVEAALALDPDYLAAKALHEQIAHGATASPADPPSRIVEPPPVPEQGWVRFEARARARRIDRRASAAREAIASGDLDSARDAMAEIREIDPAHPELISLQFELDVAVHAPPSGSWWRWAVVGAACAAVAAMVFSPVNRAQRPVERPARVDAAADRPQAVTDSPVLASDAAPANRPAASVLPGDLGALTDSRADTARGIATSGVAEDTALPEIGRPASPPGPPAASSGDRRVDERRAPQDEPRWPPRTAAVEPAAVVAPPPPTPVSRPRLDLPEPAAQPVILPTPPPSSPAFDAPAAGGAVPERTPPPAPAAPPAEVPLVRDDELARRALQQYRRGYDALDARVVQQVWPAVDTTALQRAFDGLQSQRLTFEYCRVDLRGAAATAVCRGTARYVPKVGSRDPREDARIWTFNLRKDVDAWVIASARAER